MRPNAVNLIIDDDFEEKKTSWSRKPKKKTQKRTPAKQPKPKPKSQQDPILDLISTADSDESKFVRRSTRNRTAVKSYSEEVLAAEDTSIGIQQRVAKPSILATDPEYATVSTPATDDIRKSTRKRSEVLSYNEKDIAKKGRGNEKVVSGKGLKGVSGQHPKPLNRCTVFQNLSPASQGSVRANMRNVMQKALMAQEREKHKAVSTNATNKGHVGSQNLPPSAPSTPVHQPVRRESFDSMYDVSPPPEPVRKPATGEGDVGSQMPPFSAVNSRPSTTETGSHLNSSNSISGTDPSPATIKAASGGQDINKKQSNSEPETVLSLPWLTLDGRPFNGVSAGDIDNLDGEDRGRYLTFQWAELRKPNKPAPAKPLTGILKRKSHSSTSTDGLNILKDGSISVQQSAEDASKISPGALSGLGTGTPASIPAKMLSGGTGATMSTGTDTTSREIPAVSKRVHFVDMSDEEVDDEESYSSPADAEGERLLDSSRGSSFLNPIEFLSDEDESEEGENVEEYEDEAVDNNPRVATIPAATAPTVPSASSTVPSTVLGKRPASAAPMTWTISAKRAKIFPDDSHDGFVIFFLEKEKPYLPVDHKDQALHLEIPKSRLRFNSSEFHDLFRKKLSRCGFDSEDIICWIPEVSRTKKPYADRAIYLMPFLQHRVDAGDEDASDLLAYSPADLWSLFTHWWRWVENSEFVAEVNNPDKKLELLKLAKILGASRSYMKGVMEYEG